MSVLMASRYDLYPQGCALSHERCRKFLALHQAKTGSLPHSKSSRQVAGTRAGEEDLHPRAKHTAYTSNRSFRSAEETASPSWCVLLAAPGLPLMQRLLFSVASAMRR